MATVIGSSVDEPLARTPAIFAFSSALALSTRSPFPSSTSYSPARSLAGASTSRERLRFCDFASCDFAILRLRVATSQVASSLHPAMVKFPGVCTSKDGLRPQQDTVSALARPADISSRIPRVCLTYCTWVTLAPATCAHATWSLSSLVVFTQLQYLRHGS